VVASQVLAVLASVGLIGAGVATAAETRAFDALPVLGAAGAADNARLCRVDVIRSGAPGSAAVNRLERDDTCICKITTGPRDTNGSAEDIVNALLRDRTCDGAPPPVAEAAAHGAGGASGAIIGVVLAAGVGVALTAGGGGGGGNDSAG
jgi:hypothetical protein